MRNKITGALVLVLVVVGIALAASGEGPGPTSVPNHYALDNQTSAWRTNLANADSTTVATLTSTTTGMFYVLGRKTVTIGGRFSTASATVGISLLLLSSDGTVKGVTSAQTLTAGSLTDSNARYVAPDKYFDTSGAKFAYVVVTTATSAGVVDLWAGSN